MKIEILKKETPEEIELRKKIYKLEILKTELLKKELELATFKSELNAFELVYFRIVGARYAELDEIKAKIAESKFSKNPLNKIFEDEAAQARSRANESYEATGQLKNKGFKKFIPTDNLKKLYRKVAKLIHPDLCDSDLQRLKRQELMARANNAYQSGDIEGLRSIIDEWNDSPESVEGMGAGAELIRAIRMIAKIEKRLRLIEFEMNKLKQTDSFKLKIKVEKAENSGRDLLWEMAEEVNREIATAKEELLKTI